MNVKEESKGEARLTIDDFKKIHQLIEIIIREIEKSIEVGLLTPERTHF